MPNVPTLQARRDRLYKAFYFARARPPRELLRSTCGREFLYFSMQPFGAPAALAGLGPPLSPRADADAHGHCGGGAVSRAWAVLFPASSVGKSISTSTSSPELAATRGCPGRSGSRRPSPHHARLAGHWPYMLCSLHMRVSLHMLCASPHALFSPHCLNQTMRVYSRIEATRASKRATRLV